MTTNNTKTTKNGPKKRVDSSYGKDLLDPQGIKHFLEESEAGQPLGQEYYDPELTSPLKAIKRLYSKFYSPKLVEGVKIAKYAVVVSADERHSPIVNTIKGEENFDNIQLCRVRVLSDPRHFWIPVPMDQADPTSNFHPLVIHNITEGAAPLKFGAVVSVEFNHPGTQFSSNAEVGKVTQVWAETGGYLERTFGENCILSLPPLPEPGQQISIEECGQVKKLEYTNPTVGSELVQAGTNTPGEKPLWPVITQNKVYGSPFGMRTLKAKGETEATTRMHRGVDMKAPQGTFIVSALDGIVDRIDYDSGWGHYVLVKYNQYSKDGPSGDPVSFFLRYCHLQDPNAIPIVKAGQPVFKGSLLGQSASSGRITGPHLHLEWILGNDPGNKEQYLDPKGFMNMSFWRVV